MHFLIVALSKTIGEDNKNNIMNAYMTWNEIENSIKEYNLEYFQQAHKTKVYNDKIYNKLQDDKTHNKILNRILELQDCTYEEVFKFLLLLK